MPAAVGGPHSPPAWSMKLPLRSFLKTARNAHPWLWKSPKWTFDSDGLRSVRLATKSTLPRLLRAADSFGLRIHEMTISSAVGYFCFAGYMNFASDSSSYHMYPM